MQQDGWQRYANPPETVEVIPRPRAPVDEGLADPEAFDAFQVVVPVFEGREGWQKMRYLAYRATGFTPKEAIELLGLRLATLLRWRKRDPFFASWERERLRELQRRGYEILRIEFVRNMRLALYRDYKVLMKAAVSLEELTPAERDYLRLIRRHYTPEGLVALERALTPIEKQPAPTIGQVTVYVDGKQVEDVEARRAMAREVLERFRLNARLSGETGDAIEGDCREAPGG